MKRILMALALVLALPLAALAQQQGEHMGQHGMMQGAGMHGDMAMMMRPGPAMLLQLEATLSLSEEQVAELEALQAETHEAMQTHQEAAEAARARAHHAMMADAADLQAFQAALEEAARHDVQGQVVMAQAHVQAGEVLTAEQRATLETLMMAMHEMHRDGAHEMPGGGTGQGMQHRMQSDG
jgi:Spy/CpxP family protein refolding chaperone